jgi:hypothetical protein
MFILVGKLMTGSVVPGVAGFGIESDCPFVPIRKPRFFSRLEIIGKCRVRTERHGNQRGKQQHSGNALHILKLLVNRRTAQFEAL